MVFFSSNTDAGNRLFSIRAHRDTVGFYAANGSGGRNGNSNANPSYADTSDPYSLSHRHSGEAVSRWTLARETGDAGDGLGYPG